MEIPQLQFDKVFSSLFCWLCSSTSAGQLVARPDVVGIPVMAQRQVPLVLTVHADQVIEVPTISCSPCPSHSPIPEPQSAEQLVEVPTVLSPPASPLRIAEQVVDTPVPRGRGQGSLPGQSSIASHSSGKRKSERTVEQIVDFSSPGAGLGQGASCICWSCREDFTGFSHFSPWKKCGVPGRW